MEAFLSLARQKPTALVMWLLAMLLALEFAHDDLGFALKVGDWRSTWVTMLGRDFVNVFTAGHLVLDGNTDIAYDIQAYRTYQWELFEGKVRNHNYSYPPISFFYTWIFGLTSYGVSYLMWLALTGAAFAWAARPYLRGTGFQAWAVLIIPASIANVWAGHYGFLLAALWLGAWHHVDRRPAMAGLLFGLLFVKPHLGVLVPLVLAWRGHWRVIFWASGTVAFLVAASGLVFGWHLWAAYLSDTLMYQTNLITAARGEFFLTMMPTVVPTLRLIGVTEPIAWTLQAAAALGAVGALLAWMPRDTHRVALATATATFLVLPYAFNYDLTIVGVAALLFLHKDGRIGWFARATAALAFLLPLVVIQANFWNIPLGPPVLALTLFLLVRDGRKRAVKSEESAEAPQTAEAERPVTA